MNFFFVAGEILSFHVNNLNSAGHELKTHVEPKDDGNVDSVRKHADVEANVVAVAPPAPERKGASTTRAKRCLAS